MTLLAPDWLWLLILLPPVLLLQWRWHLVDRPRGRYALAACCRLLAIAAIALALARPVWRLPNNQLFSIHLLDVSGSVDLDHISNRVTELQQQASDAVFLLGDGARPITLNDIESVIEPWRSQQGPADFRHATRLGAALSTVRLAFPADARKRLVVHSDGIATNPDWPEQLQRLQAEGILVQRASVPGLQHAEAAVLKLQANQRHAHAGDILRLRAQLISSVDQTVQLRILAGGVLLQSQAVALQADRNQWCQVDVPVAESGRIRYTAEIQAVGDRYPVNNQAACSVRVIGRLRVLALHSNPRRLRSWRRALDQQGVDIDIRGEQGLPETLSGLLAFDAIVLADVPATAFSATQLQLLRRYVEDCGGGLAMFGSENSFGLGGYYRSPVEAVLPLRSRYEKQQEEPSLGLVLIIDKSGSMQGAPIALAREASIAAVELLGIRDSAGVVAFDGQPWLVSRLRSMAERDLVIQAIGGLQANGGTNLAPAMEQALLMLDTAMCRLKHVLILSDGQSQGGNHEGLAQAMVDAGITVSTVALGQGADAALMARLAAIGGGRSYQTIDPADMPRIFTKETMTAARSAIREDLIDVLPVENHPMLRGLHTAALPPLFGYVMTRARPTANVLLATDSGDPLLAIGRFGLGTGLAFTSDVGAAWAGEWQAWDGFGRFWSQVLRAIVREQRDPGLHLVNHVDTTNNRWLGRIDRVDLNSMPIDGIPWQAHLLHANRSTEIDVQQTGPGRYRFAGDLPPDQDATLRLMDPDSGSIRLLHHDADYPTEYRLRRKPDATWQGLPDWQDPVDLPAASRSRELSPLAALAAVCFALLGILFRRI